MSEFIYIITAINNNDNMKIKDSYHLGNIFGNDGEMSHQKYTVWRYMHKLTNLNSYRSEMWYYSNHYSILLFL
jgi:hypothetical protein